ncbi:uncharacterized protein LOC121458310 [Microtus oregoni]|uniref:uncharacterized protein LOC121458310 n=1 Tax=Microtus oregoni TaxID=111838 RepID=UPI001BB12B97|nr:uncharacterized protein LOC121458310 [Microtus oregoni]
MSPVRAVGRHLGPGLAKGTRGLRGPGNLQHGVFGFFQRLPAFLHVQARLDCWSGRARRPQGLRELAMAGGPHCGPSSGSLPTLGRPSAQAHQAVHLPEVVVVAQFSLLYAQGEMWPNSKAQDDLRYLNENSQSGRAEERREERREEEHTEGGRPNPLFAALKASEFQAESRRSPTQQYSSFLGLRVQSVDNENFHPPPPCSLVYKIFVSFLLNDGSYVESNIQIRAFIFLKHSLTNQTSCLRIIQTRTCWERSGVSAQNLLLSSLASSELEPVLPPGPLCRARDAVKRSAAHRLRPAVQRAPPIEVNTPHSSFFQLALPPPSPDSVLVQTFAIECISAALPLTYARSGLRPDLCSPEPEDARTSSLFSLQ